MKKDIKNKIIIDDVCDIANDVIEYFEDNSSGEVVVVGYYETIAEIFNTIIHETDARFCAGRLYPPEVNDYDEAYYLSYDGEEIWVGECEWKSHNKYISFEFDRAYVEEDFYDKFLSNNSEDGVVVFGLSDVNDMDDAADIHEDDVSLCMDDDGYGFCFCIGDDIHHTKFKYRGNTKLSRDAVSSIINSYIFE